MAGLLGWWSRLLAIAVVGLVGLFIYTTLPPLVQMDQHLGSLADDYPTTRILRDSWGIPHIFAKTDAEVAFGLAYAHAQDDFSTIQKAFLASKGLLATVEGKSAFMDDYLVHLLRLRERVDCEYDKQLSPHLREVISAYADGLNFYAYWHTTKIIVNDLFPISPQDVVACFVHKIPRFTKLDEVARKLFNAGKGAKNQRLVNVEVRKSNMSETLGQRWRQLQSYLVSLLPSPHDVGLDPPEAVLTPDLQETEGDADLSRQPVTGSHPQEMISADAGDDRHHHHGHADGVVIDGIVYTQTGANYNDGAGGGTAEPSPGSATDHRPRAGEVETAEHRGDIEQTRIETEADGNDDGDESGEERGFASNAFAVSGKKTKDGSTLLAVNSHQPWAGPFSWYEVHLHSEEGWDFVGGVFPGCPVPLSGHNRHLGWAHTVNSPDVVDVYELTMDKDQRLRYLFDGEWHTLETRIATIPLRILGNWNWEVEREVLWSPSHNAPVIQNPLGTYAIRYSGSERIDQLDQWLAMTKAASFEEWYAAAGRQTMPVLNVVYADKLGNVFYGYNALLPQNRSAVDYDWSAPVPGNTSETLWPESYVPWDRLPQAFNPSSGFVQNCNSSPFKVTLGEDNPSPADHSSVEGMIERHMTNRALRALELFGDALDGSPSPSPSRTDSPAQGDEETTARKMDVDEFLRIKFDEAYSPRSLVAYLLNRSIEAYDEREKAVGKDRMRLDRPMLARGVALLRSWDLIMSGHSIAAPVAYFAFGAHVEGQVARRYYAQAGDSSAPSGVGSSPATWPVSLSDLGLTADQLLDDIENAARNLKRATGRADPEWKLVQRLVRGRQEWGLSGGPDLLHTVYGTSDIKKGRLVADSGDGYIQIVRWDAQGQVHSQAVQPYGSSNHVKSMHFKDQAQMFTEKRLREVWMEERLLDGPRLDEVYRPGREEELGKRAHGLLGEIGVKKRKEARAKTRDAGGEEQQSNAKRRRGPPL